MSFLKCPITTVYALVSMTYHTPLTKSIDMNIQDIMKELAKMGVHTSIHYCVEKDQYYLDLETQAKSWLYLYEDGILRGRYQYESLIDLTFPIENIVVELCYEFDRVLHGRDYGSGEWAALCETKGITLNTRL